MGQTGRSAAAGGSAQTTVVAAGTRIQGEISGPTDVLVHGQVDGRLDLGGSVVIGDDGAVNGEIEARRVRVGGKVTGDVLASERIEVLASGSIEGDVTAPRVAINAGAFFKGKVEMTSQAKAESAPAAAGKASPGPAAPPSPAARQAPAGEPR